MDKVLLYADEKHTLETQLSAETKRVSDIANEFRQQHPQMMLEYDSCIGQLGSLVPGQWTSREQFEITTVSSDTEVLKKMELLLFCINDLVGLLSAQRDSGTTSVAG